MHDMMDSIQKTDPEIYKLIKKEVSCDAEIDDQIVDVLYTFELM